MESEFFQWLTDPQLNGGGAINDFGCYGANISTCLMRNQRPKSVTAVLQNIRPEVFRKVDDEATLILVYDKVQAVVQASWNWPCSRKDVEVYGEYGYIKSVDANNVRVWLSHFENEDHRYYNNDKPIDQTPFIQFASIIRNNIQINDYDLFSLEK